MPRKPRKLRAEINRVPSNLTAEYLGGLCADYFLEEGRSRDIPSKLTPQEHELRWEFESKCHMNFEKWKKFREKKIERAKARKLKSKK
jgi:hypothetical protein